MTCCVSARAGARVAIHFLNGRVGSSFKPFHGGNVVEAVLRSRDIYAELICDGWRIVPAYVRDVIERKGIGRVIFVTDAGFAAGMKGIGSFSLGGLEGEVHDGGRYVRLKGSAQTLFGSDPYPVAGVRQRRELADAGDGRRLARTAPRVDASTTRWWRRPAGAPRTPRASPAWTPPCGPTGLTPRASPGISARSNPASARTSSWPA